MNAALNQSEHIWVTHMRYILYVVGMILCASAMVPYIGIYDLQINRLFDVYFTMWPRKRCFMTNNYEISVLISFCFPKYDDKEKWKYNLHMCSLSAKLNPLICCKRKIHIQSIQFTIVTIARISKNSLRILWGQSSTPFFFPRKKRLIFVPIFKVCRFVFD